MDGIEHRRFLDTSAPRRLNDAGVFARIGGQPTVDRMVDALYDRFEEDPMLRPLFGSDLAVERANQGYAGADRSLAIGQAFQHLTRCVADWLRCGAGLPMNLLWALS
jgi:hypothetical protein